MGEPTTLNELFGYTNNLDEPRPPLNNTPVADGIIGTFLAITWACVVFRIYARLRIIYSPGWDDIFVVLFLITGTGCSLSIFIATKHGLGEHFILLSPVDMADYSILMYVWNGCYCMSSALIKLSLLFQYLRIFLDKGHRRRFCIAMIVWVSVWGVTYSFLAWFPCFPPGNFMSQTCYGFSSQNVALFYATYLSVAASNMVMDMIILFMPLPLYFRKHTQRKTKLGLLALFTMGAIVAFLSIWRLATIINHRAGTYPTFDPSWYATTTVVLATLEVDAASICASVPVFWPILSAKLENIFVTHEVKVERSARFSTIDEEEIEMAAAAPGFPYGRPESEENLTRKESSRDLCGGRSGHYSDSFIMCQVDPLRPQGLGAGAEVTVERVPRKG